MSDEQPLYHVMFAERGGGFLARPLAVARTSEEAFARALELERHHPWCQGRTFVLDQDSHAQWQRKGKVPPLEDPPPAAEGDFPSARAGIAGDQRTQVARPG